MVKICENFDCQKKFGERGMTVMHGNSAINGLRTGMLISPIIVSAAWRGKLQISVENSGFNKVIGDAFSYNSPISSSFSRVSFSYIYGRAISLSSMTSNTTRYAPSSSSVMISGCSFKVSSGSLSGAVYLSSAVASAVVENCVFVSCYSTAGCAGLFSNAVNANVSFCCFDRCSAEYTDGSWNGGSGLSIESSSLSYAVSITFISSNYAASVYTGAMNIKSGSYSLSLHNFSNNNGYYGGAYCSGLIVSYTTSLSVQYFLFQSNKVISCVSIGNDNGKVYSQCNFINNSSSGVGAVCLVATSVAWANCSFLSSENCFFFEYSGCSFSAIGCQFSVSSQSSLICSSSASSSSSVVNCTFGCTSPSSFNLQSSGIGSCMLFVYEAPSVSFTKVTYLSNGFGIVSLAILLSFPQ